MELGLGGNTTSALAGANDDVFCLPLRDAPCVDESKCTLLVDNSEETNESVPLVGACTLNVPAEG